MKIVETKVAPNPRRVRVFLAEKGIEMAYVELDIKASENRTPEMLAKNPTGHLPFLELDDGTVISETIAICRYFEALHPEPPLMGTTALEKATIDMHQRLVEFEFFLPVVMCFQHKTGFFKDRMTPITEWGEQTEMMARNYLDTLEKHLATSTYVAGEAFSIADITLLCGIDFARVVNIRLTEKQPNLLRWHQAVSSRASTKA